MSNQKSLSQLLEQYRLVTVNSRDAAVEAALTTFGVTTEYLDQGATLYQATIALFAQQDTEKQEEAAAYDAYFIAREALIQTVGKTMKLVRLIAGKDQDLISRLSIPATQPSAIANWL